MVSFCGIWNHFTGLISGHIPHSTLTPWQEKIQVYIMPHISVVRKAKHQVWKDVQPLPRHWVQTTVPLGACIYVQQQQLQGLLRIKLMIQKNRDRSLSPCIGTYGENQSRRREKVEESRSTQGDKSEYLRHLKWDCVKVT